MALQSLVTKIEKKLGKGIIYRPDQEINTISSGSLLLDSITGGGLLIQGRMVEISGGESSGKTSLSLHSASQALKKGKQVLFIDAEQTFDANYAEALGVSLKNENFVVIQPANLEEVVAILRAAESELPDNDTVLIFDSVAAMKPKKLLEAAGEQQQIGLHAQRIGELAGYLSSIWCGKKKAYILLTNQIRRVPGSGSMFQAKALKGSGLGFGASADDSYTTTGGSQLRFMLSVRVLLDFAGKIEEGSYNEGNLARTGNYIKALTIKNKVRPPFQSVKLAIVYGKGVDDSFSVLQTLKDYEYISNSSSSFTYIDSKDNPVGEGLSFKIKGKDAFYEKLKGKEYQDDMRVTFKRLMETKEKAEIKSEAEVEEFDEDFKED